MPGQCCVQVKTEVEEVQRRAAKATEGIERLLRRGDCRGWTFKQTERAAWEYVETSRLLD